MLKGPLELLMTSLNAPQEDFKQWTNNTLCAFHGFLWSLLSEDTGEPWSHPIQILNLSFSLQSLWGWKCSFPWKHLQFLPSKCIFWRKNVLDGHFMGHFGWKHPTAMEVPSIYGWKHLTPTEAPSTRNMLTYYILHRSRSSQQFR
jgi:hypothetical protein